MPSIPYTVNPQGHGPAWGNSLFEDNGEFGYGIAKAVKLRRQHLIDLVRYAVDDDTPEAPIPDPVGLDAQAEIAGDFPTRHPERSVADAESKDPAKPVFSAATTDLLQDWLKHADDATVAYDLGQAAQAALRAERATLPEGNARSVADAILDYGEMFGKKSVWAVGGDGWAYDIDYGGLDEVLASGENINVLVLDTEGYSNTGGEMSKATELGSVSGFTLDGKPTPRKDLGRMMMQYDYVYVAHVCLGADMKQTIAALHEAESYDGPSIVIALCPCISWGIKGGMSTNLRVAREGVHAGYWPLFRFDPRLRAQGKDPLTIDYKQPDDELEDFLSKQDRFTSLMQREPKAARTLHSELAKNLEREYVELTGMQKTEESE